MCLLVCDLIDNRSRVIHAFAICTQHLVLEQGSASSSPTMWNLQLQSLDQEIVYSIEDKKSVGVQQKSAIDTKNQHGAQQANQAITH